ncbi:MAG: hypothetical protein ACK4ON_08770, partial [Bacteroidia bacterium]
MKTLIVISFLFILVFAQGNKLYAQTPQGNVVIITNHERAFPENTSMAEFDSLTHQYQVKVWDKNPYVISHRTVRHRCPCRRYLRLRNKKTRLLHG